MSTLKNQNFGVEVEMTGISRGAAADVVASVLHSTVSHPAFGSYDKRNIKDGEGRVWKVMRDASIVPQPESKDDFKVEFVTPILQYKDIELLQTIIRALREAGAIANKSCGIHVHVDGANHTSESLLRLLEFFDARQDIIYEALNVGDRKNRWCKPISHTLVDSIKKDKDHSLTSFENTWYSDKNDGYCGGISSRQEHYNSTRYHGINLHAFFSKGTVEFRLFNSTLHAGKIKAYIQFCLAMSAWAIDSDKRVTFKSTKEYTPAQKVTIFRNMLVNRLGLKGDEFKTCRLLMLDRLKKNAGQASRVGRAA